MARRKPEPTEELALMVGRRFDEMQHDLADHFDVLEVRLDGVERKLEGMEQRLDRIEFNTSGQERRISVLEDRVRQLAVKSGLTFN